MAKKVDVVSLDLNKMGSAALKGAVLFASAFMGAKGFQIGCKMYDDAVPQAVEKAQLVGLVASMNTKKGEED